MTPLLATLALLATLLPVASQRGTGAAGGRSAAPLGVADLVATARRTAWPELVARDARVSFTPRTAADAARTVAREDLAAEERAVALFAVGAGGAEGLRGVLLAKARQGDDLERRAAAFAMGELGPAAFEALGELIAENVRAGDRGAAEAALLALLRCGASGAGTIVEQLAADARSGLRDNAAALVDFARDPAASTYSETGALWLELRWRAGQRFGLVDGDSWSAVQLARITADEAFLDHMVLLGAARVHRPGMHDHLAAMLRSGAGRPALAAAFIGMPEVMDELFAKGEWAPADDREWAIVLDTIWQHELERDTRILLLESLDRPFARRQAAACLARGGDQVSADVLGPTMALLQGIDETGRSWTVWFGVHWQDERGRDILALMRDDPSPLVRWQARAALWRFGNAEAYESFREVFGPDGAPRQEESGAALAGLLEHADSLRCSELLGELLRNEDLDARERLEVAARLALVRRDWGDDVLLEEAQRQALTGRLGTLVVRALGERARPTDIAFLRSSFPSEDSEAFNRAAVLELLRWQDGSVAQLLREAIWRTPFDRSVLACALLVDLGGFAALRDELERAPRDAEPSDLRRVGFAYGRWGGIDKLDDLAPGRRAGGTDPVLQGAVLGALVARTN